jgi:SAM-dependent methyltransferase
MRRPAALASEPSTPTAVPRAAATPDTISSEAPPDAVREASIRKYRRHARRYDASCGPTWWIREHAVRSLNLQPGESVLDVGCGTGLSFELLLDAVGAGGRVYGCDQSGDMLALARSRCTRMHWDNVTLMHAPAHEVDVPERVDALLFNYTHDVLRCPRSIDRLLAQAKPGARVAVAGIKYFPRWLEPLNLWVYLKNVGYNGAPGGLRSPWDRIEPRLDGWQLQPTQWGMGYLAFGTLR